MGLFTQQIHRQGAVLDNAAAVYGRVRLLHRRGCVSLYLLGELVDHLAHDAELGGPFLEAQVDRGTPADALAELVVWKYLPARSLA